MVNELTKLHNTLLQVETKGSSTIVLADCLRYLEKLIADERSKEQPVDHEQQKDI